MDIEKIIDFKFIPEEYTEHIFNLLQSNNVNNWKLIYQLFIGFDTGDSVISMADYYFLKMMRNYKYQSVGYRHYYELESFINNNYGN